jgi:phage shock protein PspC (stress-responsive transcriptional regulator)
LAEIFAEELPSRLMVVTLPMVERAIARVGAPEDFASEGEGEPTKNDNTMERKRLRRSRTDRSIAGVCGGLANYLGIDATILRIITLCLMIFGGMSLWVYIIMWILIPQE